MRSGWYIRAGLQGVSPRIPGDDLTTNCDRRKWDALGRGCERERAEDGFKEVDVRSPQQRRANRSSLFTTQHVSMSGGKGWGSEGSGRKHELCIPHVTQ